MRDRTGSGFTLIELLIVVAIIGVLAAMAAVKYETYIERVRVARSILDIKSIQTEIDGMAGDGGRLPTDLASVGLARNDPWGFPYRYTRLRDDRGRPINARLARKDRFLVPLNDDYDLFSVGKDGATNTRLTASVSRDDVVRANNGAFIGRADRY